MHQVAPTSFRIFCGVQETKVYSFSFGSFPSEKHRKPDIEYSEDWVVVKTKRRVRDLQQNLELRLVSQCDTNINI